MAEALEIRGLWKRYGKLEAVKGIDLTVHDGEVFALIGPNGAGKTTTLRIVATILTPTSGTVSVSGKDVQRDGQAVRESISYLPEEAGADSNLSGEDDLRFAAERHHADRRAQDEAVRRGAAVADLGERLKDKAGSYSKGMTRKLMVGRTLMTEPRLAILDEPTSGLDVLNAMEVRNTIRDFASEGHAVLLSSHNMLEIEYVSDRVAIMESGVIHEVGAPSELKEKYGAQNLEEVFAEVAR
jgi:ABC-2 type transport system ATP-binding protein